MQNLQKITLILCITSASILATFITPGVSALRQAFFLSQHSMQYMMSLYLIGYLLGQLFFAFYSKKHSLVYSIKIGFIVAFIGMLLQYIALYYLKYSVFIAGRMISAFGLSSGLICGFALIKYKISPEQEKNYLVLTRIFHE